MFKESVRGGNRLDFLDDASKIIYELNLVISKYLKKKLKIIFNIISNFADFSNEKIKKIKNFNN